MKKIVNASMRSLFALAFVSACALGVARAQSSGGHLVSAQSRTDRVISARAGGVNFVSGGVEVRSDGEKEWRDLRAQDELKTGDAVRTGSDGRVEILLNPGSYLRAAEGTELTMADASLDDLRVALSRGSALVEATGYSDIDLSITVTTPQSRLRIIRSGIYRIDVLPTGAAEVSLLKGRALIGSGEMLVKGGKLARAGAGGVEVSKLEKRSRDALELWSRERGKELAKANENLTRRGVRTLLANVRFNGLFDESSSYGYSGVWLLTGSGYFTFLPFYPYWQSPYGFNYWHELPVLTSGFNTACNCRQTYTPPGISRNGEPYSPPTVMPSQGGGAGGIVSSSPSPGVSVSEGTPSAEPAREPSRPAPRAEIGPEVGRSPRERP
jgi:hypothetical protein